MQGDYHILVPFTAPTCTQALMMLLISRAPHATHVVILRPIMHVSQYLGTEDVVMEVLTRVRQMRPKGIVIVDCIEDPGKRKENMLPSYYSLINLRISPQMSGQYNPPLLQCSGKVLTQTASSSPRARCQPACFLPGRLGRGRATSTPTQR